jgi:hypothetical protein
MLVVDIGELMSFSPLPSTLLGPIFSFIPHHWRLVTIDYKCEDGRF